MLLRHGAQSGELVAAHEPERAISRTVSPARSRTSTCRYWNISILLRPTAAALLRQKPPRLPHGGG
jgi:hypothetical protein